MFTRSVDVLVADLSVIDVDEDLLSVAELGRALGIASPEHLRQDLAAHTWLRQRLGEFLDFSPAAIEFVGGEHGKPSIVTPHTDLSFNLSYSNGTAALAVGFRMDVGVDVETVDGAKLNLDMMHRVLTRPEIESVRSSPDMIRSFLKLWVRKEAIAKATGWGSSPRAVRNGSSASFPCSRPASCRFPCP